LVDTFLPVADERRAVKRLLWPLLLAAICALAFIARCWNLGDVFVAGRIYFVDADCYSRMTRAALVADGRGPVIRQHDFENFPHGTTPHTTAPLDWLILAGKWVVDGGWRMADRSATSVLRGQALDLSGALLSPLLGVLTCAWLGCWARRQSSPELPLAHAWTAPLLFAISPVLVHGTLLGRPDHQSLLLLLLAVALGLEWQLWMGATRGKGALVARRDAGLARTPSLGVAAGIAWALAMWVSLYEPLILFAAIVALWLVGDRRRFTGREFRAGWIVFAAILLVAIRVDGWRVVWPDPAARAAFAHWQTTVGELRHLDLRSPTLLHWLGAACMPAPVLLALAIRADGKWLRAPAVMLLGLLVLTVWQLRWGYFLALAYAMSLPWQLAVLRRAWVGALVFLLGLWPVAQHWEAALFPEGVAEKTRNEKRAENVQLRAVAGTMRGERAAFLAPWWLSPALAYWSGQPGVAGSSHQALPGTMETARFFLAPDAASAEVIARRLDVRWIVTDGADADGVSRLVKAYAPFLGGAAPEAPWGVAMHERGRPRERVSAEDLHKASPELREKLLALAERAEIEELGSAAFSCVFKSDFFKLFRVRPASPH
jgi:hypothetical protein